MSYRFEKVEKNFRNSNFYLIKFQCNSNISKIQFPKSSWSQVQIYQKNILQTADSTAYQLCWAGCRKSDVIPVTKAINATSEFANCYQRKIHVPVKLATGFYQISYKSFKETFADRCKSLSESLTGAFLDACIFDFMLTGLASCVDLANSMLF